MQRPTPFIAPEVFNNPDAALSRVQAIYAQSLSNLREAMRCYVAGEALTNKIRACYPFVRLQTSTDWMPPPHHEEEWLSFGFMATAGH
jgi:AMP nucleosidase